MADVLIVPSDPGLLPLDEQVPNKPSDEPTDAAQDEFKLPLPPEYQDASLESQHLPGLCSDKFSTKFLEDFRERRGQYCSVDSKTDLTCFHTVNSGSFSAGSKDSFCLAENGTAFDVAKQKFVFDCSLRDLSEQEKAAGAIPYGGINSYQYRTGPKYLLNHWTDIDGYGKGASLSQDVERNFVILLKREVDGNLWHCLNELMAIMATLDVLRMAPGTAHGKALFNTEDVTSTDIIILDDFSDGPYFELFQLFSSRKPQRLKEWADGKGGSAGVIPLDKIIIPYAGAANPLWSDWVDIDCEDNTMLRVFVRRVFQFYGISRVRERPTQSDDSLVPGPKVPRLNVTFIRRKGSRRLMGLESHLLEKAQALFSDKADVRLVDFEDMPFREQIQLARDTDVLVGMHGAGLTHAMFMEEGRGAVVEIQPDRLCHKGFRNLAKMTRTAYFVAGASKAVGNCYYGKYTGGGAREGTGTEAEAEAELTPMPDDGTAVPMEETRCFSWTADADEWAFACTDPRVTGGEQSFMVCQSRTDDAWYQTCSKKEAPDMYWLTRYVMEEDRFLRLVGDAIDEVRRRQTDSA
ncbi:unnamed protein product [Discula destructiva]